MCTLTIRDAQIGDIGHGAICDTQNATNFMHFDCHVSQQYSQLLFARIRWTEIDGISLMLFIYSLIVRDKSGCFAYLVAVGLGVMAFGMK